MTAASWTPDGRSSARIFSVVSTRVPWTYMLVFPGGGGGGDPYDDGVDDDDDDCNPLLSVFFVMIRGPVDE